MDPTTLAMERMAAEWATFMASLGRLASWGAAGIAFLLAIVVSATLVAQSDDPATDARGPGRPKDACPAQSAPISVHGLAAEHTPDRARQAGILAPTVAMAHPRSDGAPRVFGPPARTTPGV